MDSWGVRLTWFDCKTCARTLCVQQNLNNKIKFQPCSAFSSEKRMNQGKTQC